MGPPGEDAELVTAQNSLLPVLKNRASRCGEQFSFSGSKALDTHEVCSYGVVQHPMGWPLWGVLPVLQV